MSGLWLRGERHTVEQENKTERVGAYHNEVSAGPS